MPVLPVYGGHDFGMEVPLLLIDIFLILFFLLLLTDTLAYCCNVTRPFQRIVFPLPKEDQSFLVSDSLEKLHILTEEQ